MTGSVAIDSELLNRALEISGERNKEIVVTKALQEFIGRRQQQNLIDLMRKLDWDFAFDYKAERWTYFRRYKRLVAGAEARCAIRYAGGTRFAPLA